MNKRIINNQEYFRLAEEELKSNRTVTLPLKGLSMHPLLRSGLDRVVIETYRNEKPFRYEVYLFYYSGKYLLHRMRREHPDGQLEMRGDANQCSEFIRKEMIIGHLIAVKRPGGKLITTCSLRWRLLSKLVIVVAFLKITVRRIAYKSEKD